MPEIRIGGAVPKALQDSRMATFADLFCGIGGFHYAAEHLGLRCVFASEIDAAASAQYERNFGIRPAGDITCIKGESVPDHDILFAGFPCQPFSIIGDMKGTDDERGTLFHDILRVLRAKRPKAVVLENVRQFSSFGRGETLRRLLDGLREIGYDPAWKILNALDFGLPQKRERTIIVGMRSGLDLFHWPSAKEPMKPLSEVLERNPDRRHFVSENIRRKRRESHAPKESPSIWHENKGGNISSHPFSCALRAGASYNYLLVNGVRRLTPREQLRLQGFPERFDIIGSDGAIRKQTGNAVPVPMALAVIREVLDAASKDQRRDNETRTVSGQPFLAVGH